MLQVCGRESGDADPAVCLCVGTQIPISIGKEQNMLRWAIAFFIVAIIAAVFGFGGIAAGAASIAKILFFVFVVLFLVSLVVGLMGRGGPSVNL